MLKALLRVRMAALGKWFTGATAKKGKQTKGSMIGFAFLMVYAFGAAGFGIWHLFDVLASPFHAVGLDWLVYAMAVMMDFGLMFIGSVFFAKSQLFEARDNELLLSLPVKPGDILISRLVMLLVINLVFSLPVVIPVIIVRCSLGAVGGYEVLAFALVFALLPFFALAVSALFGWLFSIITAHIGTGKGVIGMLLCVALILGYSWLMIKLNTGLLSDAQSQAQAIADSVGSSSPLYAVGAAIALGRGDLLAIICAVFVAVSAAAYLLLERNYGKDGYNLLNAFCKGPEELIDLSKVIRVRNYAFEGCRSKNIVNAGNILSMDVKSFSGSVFAMDNDYEKGIKAIGRFLIGIDYSIPVIEIPEAVTENACNFDECKIAKEIVLKNDSSIDALHNCYHNAIICDKISIDYDGYISLSSLRTVRYREINVTAKNTAYDSYDGILFDDTGRFLYACPSLYEGEVVIKEGTEYIEDYAFYNVQNITSVKFPDSLKELGNSAFSNCVNLKRIDFGKGLTHIGGSYGTSVFSYCTGIKNIHIPSTIRLIGALAFLPIRHYHFR